MNTIKHYFRYNTISTETIGFLVLIIIFLLTGQPIYAIEISDSPMATQIQKAPPNIMFVLDNSGSMDRTFLVDGGGDWKTQANRARFYVFNNPGDNIRSNSYVLGGNERAEWQSQWSETNKMYYNPNSNYKPWPRPIQDPATEGIDRLPDANITTPISNPYFLIDGITGNDNITLNMTNTYYTVPARTIEVIVDDADPPPAFNLIGNWGESGYLPEWNGHSICTYSDGSAVFTPDLPESALWYVSVWWNCHTAGDNNAMITINHGGVTDTVFKDQHSTANNSIEAGVCGEWLPIDSYFFDAGTAGSVSISHHPGSTPGLSTVADAVKFEASIPGVVISNAHYYTQEWNDADNDGIKDADELTSYLVNLNPDTDTRDVYQINDLNTNDIIDDSSELIFIGHELPESIRPAIYDDEGNFVSYRNASSELQNFANWYSYYRRRELAAKAAIGEVIAKSKGTQVGFYSLHNYNQGATRQTVLPVRVPGKLDRTSTLLNNLYKMDSGGGTPLRSSLATVGSYFDATDGSGGLGASPYYDVDEGGACQHSFSIVITDGYWNSNISPDVDNADGGEGSPYQDSYFNTLADVAMYYYKRDLSSLPNHVPTKPDACDQNHKQHMVTFSVSFGLSGTIDIDNIETTDDPDIPDIERDFDNDGEPDGLGYKTDPCFLNANTPRPTWPAIVADEPSTIDDLWHAAVNGRGEFFSASNPEELVAALLEIFSQVEDVIASDAAVTIDGDVISSSTRIFGPSYDSTTWTGEVKAIEFDADGNLPYDAEGRIPDSAILWKASSLLMDLVGEHGDDHTNRKVITLNNTTTNAIPFRWANLSTNQRLRLEGNEDVLNFIRGKNDIPGFRTRFNKDFETENILGDVVHSSPTISTTGNTIFIGANDGMLHAFNAATGIERFAYIPALVFDNLAGLKEQTFIHKFFVDATPAIWKIKDASNNDLALLVGGLGKGGKGFYALNVTDADSFDAATSESTIASSVSPWEYPAPNAAADPDIGFSYSKPFIVKSNDNGKWVVIFGNGYNSTNKRAVLYIVDALTGAIIKKIDTHVGGGAIDNGLSTPALIDTDNDYKVDVVYAGDLQGNLWKFDLSDTDPNSWDVAFSGTALFSADGPSANAHPQPITVKPAVMKHPLRHGLMVLFGTGKFLGESDRIDTDVQTLYGIWDYSDSDDSEYVGAFLRASGAVSGLPGVTLLEQERLITDFGNTVSQFSVHGEDETVDDGVSIHLLRVTSDRDADWSVDNDSPLPNPAEGANAGWYFDLPIEGERLIESPLIREGTFIAVTTIPDSSYCSGGGWSIINEFDALDGSRPPEPRFDVTGKEEVQVGVDGSGNPIIKNSNLINDSDQIQFIDTDSGDEVWAAATGILKPEGGILHLSESSIVELPGAAPKREKKILSSSVGIIQEVIELAPKRGIAFWREH